MVWFVIAGLATVLIGISYGITDRSWLSGLGGGTIAAVVAAGAAIIVSLFIGMVLYDAEYRRYSFDVVAANDGTTLQGSFGIFGGFVDEEPYYFFYRKYSDGRIKQGKIPANDTDIYEDQETDAFITVFKPVNDLELWGIRPEGSGKHYEIHVPAGSVVQGAEFDLE
jgi:hypothetical protein